MLNHPSVRPKVAVINGFADTTEMLEMVLQDAGYETVAAQAREVRNGIIDLPAFARNHQLAAIVYDIAIPYDENWAFLSRLCAGPTGLPPIIITTTNLAALKKLAGADASALEIIGKPYDLGEMVRMVHAAVARSAGLS